MHKPHLFHSFAEMIDHYALLTPDVPALICGENAGITITWKDLQSRIVERAGILVASGHSCIGVLADGSFSCVLEIFAAAKAGLRIVMLDENIDEQILKNLLPYADIDCLYGDEDLIAELAPFLVNAPAVSQCECIEGREGSADSTARHTNIHNEVLFFTSGTTDRSKAVVLTQESLMASAWNGSSILPLAPEDRLLCMLPLSHVFGFVCGLLWGLSCGAAVALSRGPRHYQEDCLVFAPTVVSLVPMLLGFLLKYRALNPELKTVLIGAGDCPDELLAAATASGLRVCFGYGLTETSSGVALSVSGDPRAMEICPADTVTIAEDGEILIASPMCMMQGYYKMPSQTEAVLKEGILSTGDLGFLDSDGKLHITGRKKEMIVLFDGTKIFLPEYEKECTTVLNVRELCIIEKDGRILLILVPDPEDQRDEKAYLAALRPVLEKRPRGQKIQEIIIRKKALPRTAAGKLKRWEVLQ